MTVTELHTKRYFITATICEGIETADHDNLKFIFEPSEFLQLPPKTVG